MPFKSKAQIGKFAAMVKDGTMKKEIFDEWMKATKNPHKLPERLSKPIKIQRTKVIR
jgi:hypothetical protein